MSKQSRVADHDAFEHLFACSPIAQAINKSLRTGIPLNPDLYTPSTVIRGSQVKVKVLQQAGEDGCVTPKAIAKSVETGSPLNRNLITRSTTVARGTQVKLKVLQHTDKDGFVTPKALGFQPQSSNTPCIAVREKGKQGRISLGNKNNSLSSALQTNFTKLSTPRRKSVDRENMPSLLNSEHTPSQNVDRAVCTYPQPDISNKQTGNSKVVKLKLGHPSADTVYSIPNSLSTSYERQINRQKVTSKNSSTAFNEKRKETYVNPDSSSKPAKNSAQNPTEGSLVCGKKSQTFNAGIVDKVSSLKQCTVSIEELSQNNCLRIASKTPPRGKKSPNKDLRPEFLESRRRSIDKGMDNNKIIEHESVIEEKSKPVDLLALFYSLKGETPPDSNVSDRSITNKSREDVAKTVDDGVSSREEGEDEEAEGVNLSTSTNLSRRGGKRRIETESDSSIRDTPTTTRHVHRKSVAHSADSDVSTSIDKSNNESEHSDSSAHADEGDNGSNHSSRSSSVELADSGSNHSSRSSSVELANEDSDPNIRSSSINENKKFQSSRSTGIVTTSDEEAESDDDQEFVMATDDEWYNRHSNKLTDKKVESRFQQEADNRSDSVPVKIISELDTDGATSEEDAIVHKRRTSNHGQVLPSPDNIRKSKQKIKERKQLAVRNKKDIINLHDWIIIPIWHTRKVAVEGIRVDMAKEQWWHSSAITGRINSHTVQTSSGTVYNLHEQIHKESTVEAGFNEEVVRKFRYGFSANWKAVLDKFYNNNESIEVLHSVKEKDDNDRPSTVKTDNLSRKVKKNFLLADYKLESQRSSVRTTSEKSLSENDSLSGSPRKTKSDPHKNAKSEDVKYLSENSSSDSETETSVIEEKYLPKLKKKWIKPLRKTKSGDVSERELNDILDGAKGRWFRESKRDKMKHSSVMTPSGEIQMHSLPRTTRGRSVKPQLAWWACQRVVYNHSNDRVDIIPGTNDSIMETSGFLPRSSTRKVKKSKPHIKRTQMLEVDESDSSTLESDSDPINLNKRKSPIDYVKKGKASKTSNRQFAAALKESSGKEKMKGKKLSDKFEREKFKKPQHSKAKLSDSDSKAGSLSKKKTRIELDTSSDLFSDNLESPAEFNLKSYSLQEDVMGLLKKHRKERFVNKPTKNTIYNSPPQTKAIPEVHVTLRDMKNPSKPNMTSYKNQLNLADARKKSVSFTKDDSPSKAKRKCRDLTRQKMQECVQEENRTIPDTESESDSDSYGVRRNFNKQQIQSGNNKNKKGRLRKFNSQEHLPQTCREVDKKRHVRTKSAQMSSKLVSEDGEESPWKEAEVERLNRAVKKVHPTSGYFWERVSHEVNSRTAAECQMYYYKDAEVGPKQKTKQDADKNKRVELTGKVGTMKRKRELREMIDQHDIGYEDDIFDSTPFRTQKSRKIPRLQDPEEEDSDEEDDWNVQPSKTPTSADFRTPSSRFYMQPVSEKKTPYSNLTSPGLLQSVNRNAVDLYINRLKKAPKGRVVLSRRKPSHGVKLTASQAKVNSELFDVRTISDQDSEEEPDYYWSDAD